MGERLSLIDGKGGDNCHAGRMTISTGVPGASRLSIGTPVVCCGSVAFAGSDSSCGKGLIRLCLRPSWSKVVRYTLRRVFSRVQLVLKYDFNPICHQERLPQQAPQHLDGREYRRFPAAAYLHDDDVARLLYREGRRRIDPPAGDATPRVADIQLARLLSGKDPRHTGSGRGRTQLVVWRPV